MKKHLLILLSIFAVYNASGQPDTKVAANQNKSYVPLIKFKGDTLAYLLLNFSDNKQKYIGKDLNTLLKDEEIPIKSYSTGYPDAQWYNNSYSVLLFNSFHQNKPVIIIIKWTPAKR